MSALGISYQVLATLRSNDRRLGNQGSRCGKSMPAGRLGSTSIERMQDFHRLDVWERAHSLALAVRQATRAFPRTGYADLKSQLTRAAESIATNIVEGCAAATPKEFA